MGNMGMMPIPMGPGIAADAWHSDRQNIAQADATANQSSEPNGSSQIDQEEKDNVYGNINGGGNTQHPRNNQPYNGYWQGYNNPPHGNSHPPPHHHDHRPPPHHHHGPPHHHRPPHHHDHHHHPPHHHHQYGHGPPHHPPPHHHGHGPPPHHWDHHRRHSHSPPPPHDHHRHHRGRGRGRGRRGRGRGRGRGRRKHSHSPPPHHRHYDHVHDYEYHPPSHNQNGRHKHTTELQRNISSTVTSRSMILHKEGTMVQNKYLPPTSTCRTPTDEQKRTLRDTGCIVIKNGVDKSLIERALRKINYTLSTETRLGDIELCQSAEFINLFTQSDAFAVCQSILGEGNVKIKDERCEIALTFPEHPDYIPAEEKDWAMDEHDWCIDGMRDTECHLPQYSLLCGVALSAQQLPFSGQFVYWPGTHHEVQKKMKQFGLNKWRSMNLREISREKWNVKAMECNVDIGDIVIVHPLLCHKVGVNFSMNIAYNLCYKIQHKDFYKMDKERMDHLWMGYEGLRDVLDDFVVTSL
eukprot:633747_1